MSPGRRVATLMLTLLLAAGSGACGQKGPLTLPVANAVSGAASGSAGAATR